MTAPEIVVRTLGWNVDSPAREGEEATAQIHSLVLVDGVAMPWINGATVRATSGEFLQVDLSVAASSVKFESMTGEEWNDAYAALNGVS